MIKENWGIFPMVLPNSQTDYKWDGITRIKIKYFNPNCKIERIEVGDWIDLRSAKDMHIYKNVNVLIPFGVAMELPKGYEAHILPRSSTYKNYGIIMANGMGVVDESYCGDNDQWYFNAIALRNTRVYEGDRIAQFRIVKKQPSVEFIEMEYLDNDDRGGFGSTGIK